MKISTTWKSLALGAAASTLIACGPPIDDDDKSEPEPVDQQTAQDRLEQNTRQMSRRISDSIRFIEDSSFVLDTLDMMQGEPRCATTPCDTEPADPEIETDFSGVTDDGLDEVKKAIFNQDNVVDQTDTSITYKVGAPYYCENNRGPVAVCQPAEGSMDSCEQKEYTETQEYKDCVDEIREMKFRVQVSSPSSGNLNFKVFVGPGHNPFDVELHKNHVAVTGRLGDFKKSMAHADSVYGSQTADELPSTFNGTVKALLEKKGPQKVHFETRIQSDISIGGGDYSFNLAKAGMPVFGATADGANKTLSTTLNFKTLEASFPATHYEYQESSSGESQSRDVTLDHVAHLAGLSGRFLFKSNEEKVEVTNLGLGGATSWLKMAGEKVLSADLNSNSGGTFGMTIEHAPNIDAFDISVSRNVNASVMVKFKRIRDQYDIGSEWLMDDTFSGSLTGSPKLQAGVSPKEEVGYFKVLNGSLGLESTTPSYSINASSGQCLIYKEPTSTKVSYYHPLSEVQAGSCPQ
jgi:hypothetical protein